MNEIRPTGCDHLPGVSIYRSAQGIHRLTTMLCPTCEAATSMVQAYGGLFYGPRYYCRTCLDIWSDGGRERRPFSRYWRRDRQTIVDSLVASALTDEQYAAWTRWDAHRYDCEVEGECPECVPPRVRKEPL